MNNGTLSKGRGGASRRYTSSLREQQAGQTREKIMEAVAGLIRDGEMEDLSYNLVAEKAGVSVPTIYRYFPSRKELLDGVDAWLARELKRPPFPKSFPELLELTPSFFRYYDEAGDLFKSARVSALLREANRTGQQERDRGLAGMLDAYTRRLPAEKSAAVNAVIRLLYSFDGYQMMHDRYGVGPDGAAAVVLWALKAMTAELERDPEGRGIAVGPVETPPAAKIKSPKSKSRR